MLKAVSTISRYLSTRLYYILPERWIDTFTYALCRWIVTNSIIGITLFFFLLSFYIDIFNQFLWVVTMLQIS